MVRIRAAATGDFVSGSLPGGQVTFGLGETRKVIEIPTIDDAFPEDDGSVTLELLPGTAATQAANAAGDYELVESARSATVTVRNDDDQSPLTMRDASASEGAGTLTFDVRLASAHAEAVSMDWSTADRTAVAGADYTAASGSLTIAAGQTGGTISVAVLDDDVDEPDETFAVALSNLVHAVWTPGGAARATGTIEDNDLSVVTIGAEALRVSEGDDIVYLLRRTGALGSELTVYFDQTRGRHTDSLTASFGVGEDTALVTYTTPDDTEVIFPLEFPYRAAITPKSAYRVGSPGSVSLTVIDDDGDRTLSLAVQDQPAAFPRLGDELTFTYTVTNNGAYPATNVKLQSAQFPTEQCLRNVGAKPAGDVRACVHHHAGRRGRRRGGDRRFRHRAGGRSRLHAGAIERSELPSGIRAGRDHRHRRAGARDGGNRRRGGTGGDAVGSQRPGGAGTVCHRGASRNGSPGDAG